MENKNKQKQNEKETPNKFKINHKIVNKTIFLLVIIFGIAYLLCVNDLAIKGFKLNELKKEVNKLSEDNNKTELEIMTLKSYNNISKRAKDLSLVSAGNSQYIDTTAIAVAKNK